jgi:undecaprenyl diphosphate synthase
MPNLTELRSSPSDARTHVAIIMDGNGRWARARGLPRVAGHRQGASAVRRVVEAAPGLGIGTLTLFAFSADNWRRPASEVAALMDLFERFLVRERERCIDNGVRLNVIGRRDRLRRRILRAIEAAEAATATGSTLNLRVAVDYSARQAIEAAADSFSVGGDLDFAGCLQRASHSDPPAPEVDLLIRTSGEQRLSDFLLWECAYAELYFTERLWPDFTASDLAAAVDAFQARERRFGRVLDLAELAS